MNSQKLLLDIAIILIATKGIGIITKKLDFRKWWDL